MPYKTHILFSYRATHSNKVKQTNFSVTEGSQHTQALSDSARPDQIFFFFQHLAFFPFVNNNLKSLVGSLVGSIGVTINNAKRLHNEGLLDCLFSTKSLPDLHLHLAPQHRREGSDFKQTSYSDLKSQQFSFFATLPYSPPTLKSSF